MEVLNASIRDVKYGANVRVIAPCNLYECELGESVFVGPFCEIQSGVKIGAHTRIQSHSFICSLVSIGEFCFIGHGVIFINDTFRLDAPAPNSALWQPTHIGNRVYIGSNATILPISICDDVIIGAGSVVTRDITKSGVYVGNPARFLRPLKNTESSQNAKEAQPWANL